MEKTEEKYINFPPEIVYRHNWHVHDYIIRKGIENPAKGEIIGIGKSGYMLSNRNASIDLVPFGEEDLWEKVENQPIAINIGALDEIVPDYSYRDSLFFEYRYKETERFCSKCPECELRRLPSRGKAYKRCDVFCCKLEKSVFKDVPEHSLKSSGCGGYHDFCPDDCPLETSGKGTKIIQPFYMNDI